MAYYNLSTEKITVWLRGTW